MREPRSTSSLRAALDGTVATLSSLDGSASEFIFAEYDHARHLAPAVAAFLSPDTRSREYTRATERGRLTRCAWLLYPPYHHPIG